jgi:DNA repair protein RadC
MLASMRDKLHSRRIDPDDAKLRDYLIASMGSLADEHLRILFLDGSRHLISDECLQSGSLAHLILYPRVIFRRALELNAAAILLVHNHPSGNPHPSDEDIEATRGHALDVRLSGHIVVTANQTSRIIVDDAARRGTYSFTMKSPDTAADRRAKAELVLTNARITQRRRFLRRHLIGAEYLFVEPAWDMLLDLFIHQCEGRVLHLYPMCVASGIPMSSALRLAQKLCEAGILRRQPDTFDGRRSIMMIEPEIMHRLSAYFAEGAE